MSILTIIFNICKNKFAIHVKRGLFCLIIFKQQKKEMKNLVLISILSFILASCEKETVAPTVKLTGMAATVNDMVYDKTITSATKSVTISETVTWTETHPNSPDEYYSFQIDSAVEYTSSKQGEQPGSGVAYLNAAKTYELTATMLSEFPDIINISIYKDGKLEGSLNYHY